ncbi:MAG TPA: ABC transporter permease [Xanthobacteraceae bacterium]|nr:ABC transporter permease [Xanthobacteraceae bacterium]
MAKAFALRAISVLSGDDFWRGIVSIAVFLIFWEVGSRSQALFGVAFPWVSQVPPPSAVLQELIVLVQEPSFWISALLSTLRVFEGFLAAMVIGIPLGLAMAVSRTFYGITFPVFEVLRPIPPLAWVPASIIFWPTQELSIAFVTFLGAFFTIVINVIGGAQAIDVRYFQAARSMGSSTWDIFRRIILPATLPSIVVGATVGVGITWAVVVAAEMISGGGSAGSMGGAAGGGVGFFIWNSYVGGSYTQIVAGMISIGIAGYISSAALRKIGKWLTPWLSES